MLFGDDRGAYREIYFTAWRKFINREALEPIEMQIVEILKKHPEYHFIFNNPEAYQERDFFPELGETNPFLHLALHQAVQDQLSVDLPPGIRKLYQQLVQLFEDEMEAQHCVMNSLVMGMDDAAREKIPFDQEAYLKRLENILRDGFW